MSPNSAPRLRPTPGRAHTPALGQEPLHTIRLQTPSLLPYLTQQHPQPAPSSACSCSAPVQHIPVWINGFTAGELGALRLRCLCWGQPHMCLFSHFSPYVSGRNLRESQCLEVQEGGTDLVR